ncbi:DUF7289 family protein [Halovenus salina]|uniref:Flagellin n=1 Tax=Halovenus salina TaxID=1510225 RepID=A0ABD5VXP4_9EURY|nr:hypothetical protein [Halovenus salina]
MRRREKSEAGSAPDTNRAVSDAIGFTLMFAIIIVGTGLISFAGGTQLSTLSDVEEVRSAERGMESTAATLHPMATQGDRQRSFSIAFSNSNVWMNATVLNVTTRDGSVDYSDLQVNALQQRFDRSGDDVTVRYEAGGVFRTNAVPAFDPSFECRSGSSETALVTVVNLTLAERDGLYVSNGYNSDLRFDELAGNSESPVTSTDESLTFEARLVDSEQSLTEGSVVVNTTQTAGPEQWGMYFDDQGGWDNLTDNVYECSADQTLVRVVTIELDIIEPRFSG